MRQIEISLSYRPEYNTLRQRQVRLPLDSYDLEKARRVSPAKLTLASIADIFLSPIANRYHRPNANLSYLFSKKKKV